MSYIKLRCQYEILIYIAGLALLIVSTAIWRPAVFYIAGLFFLLGTLETILVKCPSCGKRPVRLLWQFPHYCRHCSAKLYRDQQAEISVGVSDRSDGARPSKTYERGSLMSVTLVELIDKAMMRRVIVWLLMCLAIPLYVGAAYLYSTSWPESVKPLSPGIEKVFFVGSCALAVSSLIIYRRLLSVRRLQDCLNRAPDVRQLAIDATFGTDGEDILRKIDSLDPWELRLLIIPAFLVRPLLVSTSLNSMIAFLGLILSLLTRRFLYSIPFAAAALVLNGLVFPRIKPLIDRANGMRDNLEAFR